MALGGDGLLDGERPEPFSPARLLQGDRAAGARPVEEPGERTRRRRGACRCRRDRPTADPAGSSLVVARDARRGLPGEHPHGCATGAVSALSARALVGAASGAGALCAVDVARDALTATVKG